MNDGPLIVQSDKTLLLEVDHPSAVEARKAAQQRGAAPRPIETRSRGQQVVSLTEQRLADQIVDLPGDDRPLPSVDAYDDLLGTAGS